MDKQIAASYDDLCRICGDLYIQAQLKLGTLETNQMELTNALNNQLGATRAENDRLQKELGTLRTAYYDIVNKQNNGDTPAVSG